ncbi:MAG: hypothetical protein ACR2H1_02685 [Limisphaerales bacterium]
MQTIQGKEWVRHTYANEFCFEKMSSGDQKICVTTSGGYVDLILSLAATLPEPFFILYVLILSRKAENQAARYQSKEVTRAELQTFFEKFEDYFDNDGRHHVWVHSPASSTTLVYDNHNVIYAYGSLETFSTVLQNNGFKLVEATQKLGPHGHCYNREFDSCENDLMKYWQWKQSPLQPQDDPR